MPVSEMAAETTDGLDDARADAPDTPIAPVVGAVAAVGAAEAREDEPHIVRGLD